MMFIYGRPYMICSYMISMLAYDDHIWFVRIWFAAYDFIRPAYMIWPHMIWKLTYDLRHMISFVYRIWFDHIWFESWHMIIIYDLFVYDLRHMISTVYDLIRPYMICDIWSYARNHIWFEHMIIFLIGIWSYVVIGIWSHIWSLLQIIYRNPMRCVLCMYCCDVLSGCDCCDVMCMYCCTAY